MKPPEDDPSTRAQILSDVALAHRPPDTVIANGTVFNVFTGEFIPEQSIWIKDGRIAYVGGEQSPRIEESTLVIDAKEMALIPGLIDGHTHIVFRTGIEEFVKHVIPAGTTTVITETIELATIAGKAGFEYLVNGLSDQPIRFYYTLSPLCGLTPSQETQVPTQEEMLDLLKDPTCLGVGEVYWGNLFLTSEQGARVRELAATALGLDKRVEGHSAGARGNKLQAYTCFGVTSCHEPIDDEQVLERLRLGYWVMLREGAIRKELEGVRRIFEKDIDLRRLILSTDGVDPQGFLTEGYLDASLRSALRLGVPPALVYQMATLNVAEHFRLDHLIGSLAPGKSADIVMIPSPEDYSPRLVMCRGRILFRDGTISVEPRTVTFPDPLFHTVHVGAYRLPSIPPKGQVRVMELVNRLVTKERFVDLGEPDESKGIIMALALDRLGLGGSFLGLLKGFGLHRGACGSTMCWDTGDMIVVGCDPRSMKTVIERLQDLGGGAVYAIEEQVVSEFPAPLCGIISLKSMTTVAEEVRRVESSLRGNGVIWERPLLTIDTLGTAAIPHLRITHEGYVSLKERKVLPLEV